jgi:protease I
MKKDLKDIRVAILVTDGFEHSEMTEPQRALEEHGAITEIISLKGGRVRSWKNNNWGDEFDVTKTIDTVASVDYDALLLPGGVMNPDKLRMNMDAVNFVRDFVEAGKPIAAICHGPWMLVEAGACQGRTMTSYESIRTDIENAGGSWVDEPVVTDEGIVTSRKPADIPQFNKKMVEEFAEGVHRHRTKNTPSA